MNTVTFRSYTWDEWVADIIVKTQEAFICGDIDLDDLIHAPKLDPDNPQPFCKAFMFEQLYENRVFVSDHKTKDCYWFINSDNTACIFYPKL
jgi:hypothetical protein